MNRFQRKLLQDNRGFSLVELLVVVVLTLIIGGAIVAALVNQTMLTASQNRNVLNQENLRDSMRFISDEMQSLGSGATEPYIMTAAETSFDFIGDVDGNGEVDRIQYTFDGTKIDRVLFSTSDSGVTWTTVRTDLVIGGVSDASFTYYAFGDAVPGSVDEITSVEISLTLNSTRGTTKLNRGKVADQGMASRVTLRNRL